MMKIYFIASVVLLLSTLNHRLQGQISIPDVELMAINGNKLSGKSIGNGGNPFIICFWKSCCNSSLKFMEALNEVYPDLVDDYNIKVFAIAIDDSRTSDKVKPLVNGNAWEFEFYLDTNEELARKMNINLTPHILLFDGDENLVWQKSVCMQGDEYIIEKELRKLK